MRKLLYSLLLLLLLAVVAVAFAAGPGLRWYIDHHGPELVHRRMQVQEVSVNLLTGHVEAEQLVIYELDGDSDFIRIPHLETRLSLLRLLTGTYYLDGLQLHHPQVSLWQRDTLLSCHDVIGHLTADDGGEPLPLLLHDIQLRQGELRFRDLSVGSDFRMTDLTLDLPDIDLRQLSTSLGLDLQFADGGTLQTHVTYDEPRQTYQLHLALRDYPLQSLLPYARQHILLGDLQGELSLDLAVRGHLDHLLDFTTRGEARVRQFAMIDPDDAPLLLCDSLELGIRSLDLVHDRYRLSALTLHHPAATILFAPDSLDNFSRLLVTPPSASFPPSASTALQLSIDRLAIEGGELTYRDASLRADPFDYQVSHIELTAPNFTLEGRNHLTAQARLGEQGHITLRYDGWIENMRNMHLELQARDVAIADFSPYTVQMFGNEVTAGTLSLEIFADTHQGELYSTNHLRLVDPRVEKKRRDVHPEMNIPFRTGLYVLTDRDNVCDLDLPVHGNILEPRFSYKRLLFRTLGRFLVKVCTSPFRSRRSAGATPSLDDDTRSLDDIDLDHVSDELLQEE